MSIYDTAYRRFLAELRGARQAVGLSQEELAIRLDKHQTFVSKVEKGQRYLDVLEFIRWTNALDVDPVQLVSALRDDVLARKPRRKSSD
ncbi:MAG: helix-turn-helix domain-containing protein [Hydrogenophaga sp.]|jgi:transcriptional regulator with XRE-family HTH domain|uniref:helix-turn-helix domain-containing protein n=1 Tax=Hydrogenophaga sp. TaxID=1904254 RepID=UPI001D6B9C24|nr:helix-turn-helix transcriptional regulator [Hydrogenophaga sp.]MBW0170965.1 helix-turn-helix domain-containing protein [Hydrogenophaga sp.]MBW0185054.1 helix-turn-helix domain-containing protein [Hydrogenophaga sp.]